ncbi:MAG TPA: EVE domain-containing protein, partial [Bradyrhizobium sp.]|nr:EVE domain-containing protein [Bradyrhizobium sp.]
MAGLDPAIHVLLSSAGDKDVDARHKAGHDEWRTLSMNYWLVKSEPSSWSWDQQVEKGAKGEAWTGVRNFTARQNL